MEGLEKQAQVNICSCQTGMLFLIWDLQFLKALFDRG